MNQQTTLFSNEKLMAMIIPLFLEQLLIMLVGMADTLVVSYWRIRQSASFIFCDFFHTDRSDGSNWK